MLNKIQVGEYVRTNDGAISQITKITFDEIDKSLKWYWYDNNTKCTNKPDIVKHSKNIIDLIEVGDFVNGDRIYKITNSCIYPRGKAIQNKLFLYVETILSHEQYESNAFKIQRR